MIERRAVFLDLAHRTPGLGYKNGNTAFFQHTNTMPLYYLFGLEGIEPSSFGEAVFLVALRWFLAAMLGTLIGALFRARSFLMRISRRSDEPISMPSNAARNNRSTTRNTSSPKELGSISPKPKR